MINDLKIKYLIYQSAHRGCKETDIILGQFCTEYVRSFSKEDIVAYEALLNENDIDIYNWYTKKVPLPETHKNKVTNLLMNFVVKCI